MPQKQAGWRFDPWIFEKFKDVCRRCGFKPSKVVERFMEAVVENGDPELVIGRIYTAGEHEKRALEAQARVLLAKLRSGTYWIYSGGGQYNVEWMLLEMLPRLEDEQLIQEIEMELKKRK